MTTERSRNTAFARRIRTRIWDEVADPSNPWLATTARCHGYALDDMIARLDYPQSLFLLLRGELPNASQRELLRRFLVAFCNPGPRHAATRAIMNAAVSGSQAANLAAIGLGILGGDHLGSGEVANAARFIARERLREPEAVADALLAQAELPAAGDRRIAPGFGSLFGAIDPFAAGLADAFTGAATAQPALAWSARFAARLAPATCGWLVPGLAAAVCLDMGFAPGTAAQLFQLAALPGLLAHGIEMSRESLDAMPFVPDADYEFTATADPAHG